MIRTIVKIKDLSVIEQNQENEIRSFEDLSFDDKDIGSGTFGSVYNVTSIDGDENDKYVLKILSHNKENQEHAYKTIEILHLKIKRFLAKERTGSDKNPSIYNKYPELLGLPFIAFNGYDEVNETNIIGFLMFNLNQLGFKDYGLENNTNILKDVVILDKFLYSYQLSRVISFLHKNKFIHADISANAIWINTKTKQLAIIDFDSGFHYDKQEKPITIGKITQWMGGLFRSFLNPSTNDKEITISERIAEEYWILANACFEILTGQSPYFFLIDADDNTKKKYLKNNRWPEADTNSEIFNKKNINAYNAFLKNISVIEKTRLKEVMDNFNKVFNKGYSREKVRLSPKEWEDIFFDKCKELDFEPQIINFNVDKSVINKKREPVVFSWENILTNTAYLNGDLLPLFTNNKTLNLLDETKVELKLENIFGEKQEFKKITAIKKIPKIDFFKASSKVRNDINPIELKWGTENVSKVLISTIEKNFEPQGSTFVEPATTTKYILSAIGYFEEEVTASVLIDVIKPKIDLFTWEININKGIYNVDISWETSNTKSVSIEPNIGTKPPKGIIHVDVLKATEYTLIANGLFSNEIKKMTVQSFPVPVIKNILTETPKIELNYSFNTDNLKIPANLLEIPKIDFVKEVSIDTKVDYDQFIKLEYTNTQMSKLRFENNKKYLDLYKKNQLAIKQMFNKVKKMISKKTKDYENKKND